MSEHMSDPTYMVEDDGMGLPPKPEAPKGWRIVDFREPEYGDHYLFRGQEYRSFRNMNDPTDRYDREYWWIVEPVTNQEETSISVDEGGATFAIAEDYETGEKVVVTAEDVAKMRVFESGATRNVEVDPDYHGFLSPLALHAYGEYMHRHRLQADGTLRDSDNWQKGIPNDAFVRSLVRHVHDIQLVVDGYGELARQDDRDDNVLLAHLSAALFNVQGLLHNVMLELLMDERIAEAVAAVEARLEEKGIIT